MSTLFRKIILSLFICTILFGSTISTSAEEEPDFFVRLFRLFRYNQEFNQYLEIDYNTSFINESLTIEKSLNVPIHFTYWTDVPDSITNFKLPLPFMFKNKVIFGKGMPQQFLVINITSKPEWLRCNFTTRIIPVDIPVFNDKNYEKENWFFKEDTYDIPYSIEFAEHNKSKIQTSLILSPLMEAPARRYSIGITAYLQSWGMMKEAIYSENITFKPSFFPKIDFQIKDPLVIKNPRESINYKIIVTNTANKLVKIFPKINEEYFSLNDINPNFLSLYPDETANFSFSQVPKNTFGWSDTNKTFLIDFYVETAPFSENNSFGPYSIKLSLNSYGFSTPGFTVIFIIISLILLSILKKFKCRERS